MAGTIIDAEALRARYRAERDKRVRADGNEQYLQPSGRFTDLLDDPYAQRVERPPCTDEATVVVIGGGFAGLVTGARLKQAGVTDVRIIEGGGDVGGAWYWNRYPGAMCDTAAMIYLPLLEETGHMPSHKYVPSAEIFGHARRIADHFDLRRGALFSTSVTGLEWDDASSRWIVRTDRGDEIRARFVAMGTGPLHRPKLPGIPGIDAFAGLAFVVHRRPQQPADRPEVVLQPGTRLAAALADQLRRAPHRWRRDQVRVNRVSRPGFGSPRNCP